MKKFLSKVKRAWKWKRVVRKMYIFNKLCPPNNTYLTHTGLDNCMANYKDTEEIMN